MSVATLPEGTAADGNRALAALAGIGDHVDMFGRHDPFAALRLTEKIEAALRSLEQTPAMQRRRPNPLEQQRLDVLRDTASELRRRGHLSELSLGKLPPPWQVTIRNEFPEVIDDEFPRRWKLEMPDPPPFPPPWEGPPPKPWNQPDPKPLPLSWKPGGMPDPPAWKPGMPDQPAWKPEPAERMPWDPPDPEPFPPGS